MYLRKKLKHSGLELIKRLPFSSKTFGPPKAVVKGVDLAKTFPQLYHQAYTEQNITLPLFPFSQHISQKQFPFLKDRTLSLWESYVLCLESARIFSENAVAITSEDLVLAETATEWIPCPSKHSVFRRWKLPKLHHTEEKVAVLASKSPDCYYHWLFDILPRVQLLRNAPFSYDAIYANPLKTPFQKDTWELLGLQKQKTIWSHKKTHLMAKELIVPSLPARSGAIPKWSCQFLRDSFLPAALQKKSPLSGSRLYISRSKAPTRRICNEDEMTSILKKRQFEIICLEDFPFLEQVRLFHQADRIIAQHGSALSNLAFSKAGTQVLEIFTPGYINPCYWTLSHHLHLKHKCIMGEVKNLSEEEKSRQDVRIDPSILLSFLKDQNL